MKTTIVILLVISLIAITAFFWLSFENINSSKTLESALKLCGAIVIASILFSVDFIQDEKKKSQVQSLMIYHKNTEPIIFSRFTDIDSQYGKGFNHLSAERKYNDYKNQDIISKGFEDFNFIFLEWLHSEYKHHWDIEKDWFQGIGGGGGGININKNADAKTEKINISKFSKEVSPRFDSISDRIINFPLKTILSFKSNKSSSNYHFENKYFVLEVKMSCTGGGKIGTSLFGKKLGKTLNPLDNYETVKIVTTFNITYKKFRLHSNKTLKVKKWINTLTENFEKDFGWEMTKNEMSTYLEKK